MNRVVGEAKSIARMRGVDSRLKQARGPYISIGGFVIGKARIISKKRLSSPREMKEARMMTANILDTGNIRNAEGRFEMRGARGGRRTMMAGKGGGDTRRVGMKLGMATPAFLTITFALSFRALAGHRLSAVQSLPFPSSFFSLHLSVSSRGLGVEVVGARTQWMCTPTAGRRVFKFTFVVCSCFVLHAFASFSRKISYIRKAESENGQRKQISLHSIKRGVGERKRGTIHPCSSVRPISMS